MASDCRLTRVAILATLFLVAPLDQCFATGGDYFDVPAPSVGDSLDFLPGKSLGEIFVETGASISDDEQVNFDAEILRLAERLREEPAASLIKVADGLLVQARQHYSGDWCNLLHDVRDVLAGSADDKNAAADYIKWRVENKGQFGRSLRDKSSPSEEPKARSQLVSDLEKRSQNARGALKAHWLYLCGAALFATGDRVECRPWFERVTKEFPKHPRAEIALFMQARCAFSESRIGIEDQYYERTEVWKKERAPDRKRATEMFERYRKQYPHGRFEADALGWLGALAFDSEEYLKALEYYIAQVETPGHPETVRSGVFMCEKCLVRVAEKPDGTAAFALIARHPRIAMGFTYLVLSAPEAKNYDGSYDRPADVKKWRQTILPRIAAEVVKQKKIYQSGDWQPRYLAMLAQAASAAGNQDQALELTNLVPVELDRSDDLLMVRGIAFQRAGKSTEAIDAYRKCLAAAPASPAAPGIRLRLAFALQDNHQAGQALAELKRLLSRPNKHDGKTNAIAEENDSDLFDDEGYRYTSGQTYPDDEVDFDLKNSSVYPNITGADLDQIQQSIDTLLNFAPLTELATALDDSGFDDKSKSELRLIIAQRYLAQENFAEAKKLLSPDQFAIIAANLETLTNALAGSSADQAEKMSLLGDAWADARGKLLRTPLDTKVRMLRRYQELNATRRRENGRSLRLKNVDAELQERDELRHASRWWMKAARARPGTPLAAKARWKALEAMPKIAAASPYAEQLAREINGEAVSREIYDILRKESPDSGEAKRLAAYWSFPPAAAPEDQYQYHDSFAQRDAHILGYSFDDFGAFGIENPDDRDQRDWSPIAKRIAALPGKVVNTDMAAMRAEINEIDSLVRGGISGSQNAACINFLDDLVQFLKEPNVTDQMLKIYLPIRFDVLQSNGWDRPYENPETPRKSDADIRAAIDGQLADPIMQPVADYLEFCQLGLKSGARTAVKTDVPDLKEEGGKATYVSRDYAGLERMARDFLKKYPQSQKREAALFVVARSVQWLSRPHISLVGSLAPGTQPNDEIYDVSQKSNQLEAFDPKRVLAALDEYDREFPNGRYAADVRNLRAMTFWRLHQWGPSLDLTLPQLDDTRQPDLQAEAAVRLANIFADLAEPEYRMDILEAIRTRPNALLRLKQFLGKAPGDRTHPLRYLVRYLDDKLKLSGIASN